MSFHDGSARNALEVEPPFEKYVFIEKNINRYAELEELRKEFLLKTEFSENMIECVPERCERIFEKFMSKKLENS